MPFDSKVIPVFAGPSYVCYGYGTDNNWGSFCQATNIFLSFLSFFPDHTSPVQGP
jgi:hypothetical protein